MGRIGSEKVRLKAKRTFLRKGTCSRTFFYLLDREFRHPMDEEEKAIDPLAGGILQQGYQCGMLWGASMAIGAEAFRRKEAPDESTALAILATRHIMDSFVDRASSIECEDVTQTDFQNKRSFARYMLTGKFVNCFILAGKWAPEALQAAREGLDLSNDLPQQSLSCASEVVRMMGGSTEEILMVAGFAGGLGLSGSGCGALAAAVWKITLARNRMEGKNTASYDPATDPVLRAFYEETGFEMHCDKICGKVFNTVDEHSEFIRKGGCNKLIRVLAATREG